MIAYIPAYVFRQTLRKTLRRVNRRRAVVPVPRQTQVHPTRHIDYSKWKQDPDGTWSPRYTHKKRSCVKDVVEITPK